MSRVSRPVVSRLASASFAWAFLALLLPVFSAREASAQTTDVIGVRAQGMAGAFTAVADDATAGWWNPAGLAGGAFFNGTIEYGRPDRSTDETMKGVAAAYPALGISYYRLPVSQIRVVTSTVADAGSRKDQGVLSLYGATVGQSLGEHLVIGSTLKLLHAGETHTDLDIGVMATFGPARIGATLRNVFEPSFGSGADAFTLQRHARAGFALTSGKRGVIGSATLGVDADLTREQTIRGEERFLAVGGEAWAGQRSLAIRGGLRRNMVGVGETLLTGGVSAAVRQSTFVDAYVSTGSDDVRHGWGAALRVTF
jgi:hypothetical protein